MPHSTSSSADEETAYKSDVETTQRGTKSVTFQDTPHTRRTASHQSDTTLADDEEPDHMVKKGYTNLSQHDTVDGSQLEQDNRVQNLTHDNRDFSFEERPLTGGRA